MSAVPAVAFVQEGATARAALHPLRRALLERLTEPASAAALARDLDLPRQKVNYHLRLLEEAELVELVEERKVGNCTERLVRARAEAFVIAPGALGDLAPDPARIRDRFSAAYLMAVASQAVHDLGELGRAAEAADKKLPTLTLEANVRFASPETQRRFAEELSTALRDVVARYHDDRADGGRTFRFFVGGHPARSSRTSPPRNDSGATT